MNSFSPSTPYEEEAIDDQYIDKIYMDAIMHIIAGNTTRTKPPTMEYANENHLLALLTLRTLRHSVEVAPPQYKYVHTSCTHKIIICTCFPKL